MFTEVWTESRPGSTPRVLVVDDEHNLVDLVLNYLKAEGYAVLSAGDGLTALELAHAERPDLVILDVMLPGLDGVEVCRRLRLFSDAYVLMLSARSEELDKIVGLSVGADDYLTKPFSPRELVARVKAMLRRPRSGAMEAVAQAVEPDVSSLLLFGDLMIDLASHEVVNQSETVHLTPREFDLLATLASHPGRVFTRNQLLEQVWGDRYFDDHVVDVHMNNLRKKLGDDPTCPSFVETVRGVGYRFAARTSPNLEGVR